MFDELTSYPWNKNASYINHKSMVFNTPGTLLGRLTYVSMLTDGVLIYNLWQFIFALGQGAPNWFSGCSVPIKCFSCTLVKICGRGSSLRTTTYPKTVVVVSKGHAPCKTLVFQQGHLLYQSNFMENMRLL